MIRRLLVPISIDRELESITIAKEKRGEDLEEFVWCSECRDVTLHRAAHRAARKYRGKYRCVCRQCGHARKISSCPTKREMEC